MKKYLYSFLFLCCLLIIYWFVFIYNDYSELDTEWFRNSIKDKEIYSRDDLIQSYFIYRKYDYIPEYKIENSEMKSDSDIIFSYILQGDSISSNKILISVDLDYKNIDYIWKTWKCHKGRGHRYWSNQKCY